MHSRRPHSSARSHTCRYSFGLVLLQMAVSPSPLLEFLEEKWARHFKKREPLKQVTPKQPSSQGSLLQKSQHPQSSPCRDPTLSTCPIPTGHAGHSSHDRGRLAARSERWRPPSVRRLPSSPRGAPGCMLQRGSGAAAELCGGAGGAGRARQGGGGHARVPPAPGIFPPRFAAPLPHPSHVPLGMLKMHAFFGTARAGARARGGAGAAAGQDHREEPGAGAGGAAELLAACRTPQVSERRRRWRRRRGRQRRQRHQQGLLHKRSRRPLRQHGGRRDKTA